MITNRLNSRFCWKQQFHGAKFPTRPVWAREHCRISPPRFLAECCKRQLNQGSFVLLHFQLFTFSDLYWVCLSVFSCTVLFVSISQVIGCEDRVRNDLYCVEWGVKLYSNQTKFLQLLFFPAKVPVNESSFRSLELSLLGAKVLRSEKAIIHFTRRCSVGLHSYRSIW